MKAESKMDLLVKELDLEETLGSTGLGEYRPTWTISVRQANRYNEWLSEWYPFGGVTVWVCDEGLFVEGETLLQLVVGCNLGSIRHDYPIPAYHDPVRARQSISATIYRWAAETEDPDRGAIQSLCLNQTRWLKKVAWQIAERHASECALRNAQAPVRPL